MINIAYHAEDGTVWADSDDLPGFYACSASVFTTQRLVREHLALEGITDEVGECYYG